MKKDTSKKSKESKRPIANDSIRNTTQPLKLVNKRVSIVLSRYYLELKSRLCKGPQGNFLSMSYEDIFQNAIIWTLQDKKTADLKTDKEIIEFFEKKYRSTEMQIIGDSKLLPLANKEYAHNKQAKTDESE